MLFIEYIGKTDEFSNNMIDKTRDKMVLLPTFSCKNNVFSILKMLFKVHSVLALTINKA